VSEFFVIFHGRSAAGERPLRVVTTTAEADGDVEERTYREVIKLHTTAPVAASANGDLVRSLPRQPANAEVNAVGILITVTRNVKDVNLDIVIWPTYVRVVEKMTTVLSIISEGTLFPPEDGGSMFVDETDIVDNEDDLPAPHVFGRVFSTAWS
jgi:hypothetical protein